MQWKKSEPICVLGAGNFGTCLAQHLASMGHKVFIWARSSEVAESINSNHINPKQLSHVSLNSTIEAFHDIDFLAELNCKVLVFAIPTQSLRSVLGKVKKYISESTLLICAAKGIEIGSHQLPLEIFKDELGENIAGLATYLSGPSFAVEVVEGLPTGVSVASKSRERRHAAQRIFHAPTFRVYTSSDPVGLEVAGALKNVIAIASGACNGLGLKSNSQATLITRGLAEITRLGVRLQANPITFNGLGGVGDLFLTCTSIKSRNYQVGHYLGQGEKLAAILEKIGSVAEGVTTAKAAYHLGQKLNVSLPITNAVYQVLFEDKPVKVAVNDLIMRDARDEDEFKVS